jgi:hypothetical protein
LGENIMAYPNIIVASAGTTAVNGTYVSNNTQNSRPIYRLFDAFYYIFWDDPDWYIWYSEPGVGSAYLYTSTDDVATPDLCTTWTEVDGDAPVPTVTEESAGASGGGFPILNGSIVR